MIADAMHADRLVATAGHDRHRGLQLRGISKSFSGNLVLKAVDLTVDRGTVHGLVGENGAGKSTLGKVCSGIFRPDSGEIFIDGTPVRFRGPRDALKNGVAIIAQEVALVPQLTVQENVFLGIESNRSALVGDRMIAARYRNLLATTGFDLPGDVAVGSLRLAEQQIVEIMRAIARDVRVIVMDEPTASLGRDQAADLFNVIRNLREQGISVVYVSHFLHEVLEICDFLTVMRDGARVSTGPRSEYSHARLVTEMLGSSLDAAYPDLPQLQPGAPLALTLSDLSREPSVSDVSFSVRRGEILGIAGLVGSGRSEMALCVFGADRASSGVVAMGEWQGIARSIPAAIERGIGLVPESRKEQGLVLNRSLLENLTLGDAGRTSRFGVISRRAERRRAADMLARVDVRGGDIMSPVGSLSGGNQQKVLLARWISRRPTVLIVDEPTRGVDVGARKKIYEMLVDLAAEGTAIILISSDLEEVTRMTHRVIAMRRGRVVGEFASATTTEREVLDAMFGIGKLTAQEPTT